MPMASEAQQDYWRRRLVDATTANYHRAVERLNEAYAVQEQDIRDARVRHIIAHLCRRLYTAGAEAGVSETLARGIEMGLDLNVDEASPLFAGAGDDGPLQDDWQWDD
jgi:hypothetical protein